MLSRISRKFLNPELIEQNLICSICFEVFEDPSTLSCSHTFCYSCIVIQRRNRKSCPLCRNKQRNFNPIKNLQLAHQINELLSKCSHQECTWQGKYHLLKNHQRNCEFKPKKENQFSDDDLVEINIIKDENQNQQIVGNSKGRKKIKTDSQNFYEIFFQRQENYPYEYVLIPPKIQEAQNFLPMRGRFFDKIVKPVQNLGYKLHDNKNKQNGSRLNPIQIDVEQNQVVHNIESNEQNIEQMTNIRPNNNSAAKEVKQQFVMMTRSRVKKFNQKITKNVQKFI